MRRSVRLAWGLLLFAAGAFGQATPKAPVKPAEPTDGGLFLRFEVTLVQVDAVVTDSKGKHVTDLAADDFELLLDGKPQRIAHFSYIPGGSEPPPVNTPAGSVRPGLGTLTAGQIRRTILLYMDDAKMDASEFLGTKAALRRFLDKDVQAGDLVAVFRTAFQTGFWQRFTSDPQYLRRTIDRMQYVVRPLGRGTRYSPRQIFALRNTLTDLARIPGRKALVYFGRIVDWDTDVGDLANRSSVTIYAIDPAGLPTGFLSTADSRAAGPSMFRSSRSQGGASTLAAQTGGLFFYNNNDLGGLLSTAVADFGGGYYLLGWYPGDEVFRRGNNQLRYHRIKVRVRRKGLSVRSRSGFLGRPGLVVPPAPASTSARMLDAIWSPFRSGDLDLELTTRWGRDDRSGPYVEAVVHVAPEGLEFQEEAGGCRTARLEFLFGIVPMTTPLTNFTKPQAPHLSSYLSSVSVCGETAQRLARDGLVWRVREKTWNPGPYDVRVAVRNAAAEDRHSLPEEAPWVRHELPNKVGSGSQYFYIRSFPTCESCLSIKVGSGSQYLEIPNLSASKLAVAGLTLGGAALKETADQQRQGVAVRVATDADPGVRRFRRGEEVQYDWRVLSAPGNNHSPIEAHISVVRDGKEIFSGPSARLTFVNNEARVMGGYRIESLEPGRYWLAATAVEKTDKGKTKRTATEWLHFDVSE